MTGINCITSVEDLPAELLLHIFQFIPIRDYLSLSLVCKNFYLVIQSDWIWQLHCKKLYNQDIDCWTNINSYHDLYRKVLHRYGPLLGLWYRDIDPYGGLACIKIENSAIVCNEYVLRRNEGTLEISNEFDIIRRSLFKITPNDDDDGVFIKLLSFSFLRDHNTTGSVIILRKDENQFITEFQLKCVQKDDPESSLIAFTQFPRSEIYRQWFLEENPNFDDEDIVTRSLLEKKLHVNLLTLELTSYMRLTGLSRHCITDNMPLCCGIYSGSYGAHGVEILHVYVEDNMLIGKKLSGDPNVPAGTVSVRAFLDRPAVDTSSPESHIIKNDRKLYPFSLPADYNHRSRGIPTHYYGGFDGEGQIAYHGYKDPKFIPGLFVIFDKDTFGFLWMERLKSFILFRALNEKDLFLGHAGISWE